MVEGLCPCCGRVSGWEISGYSVSLPPTGGDYDWLETDGTAVCGRCGGWFGVRVRVDLDDRSYVEVVEAPGLTVRGWVGFVLGKVLG